MREKAVNDPSIRWKDPKAWECLSNDQRDIIAEWYEGVSAFEKEEKEEEINLHDSAALFAITPFACAYGLMNNPFGWRMLLDALCAFLLYGMVFCFSGTMYYAAAEQRGKSEKRGIIFHLLAIFLSFFVTALMLSLVEVI